MPRIYSGIKVSFNKWGWERWMAAYRTVKHGPLSEYTENINSEWIKDLNIKSETIKFLEENRG